MTLVIIILLLCLIFILYQPVLFLHRNDTCQYFKQDPDEYFDSLSMPDLISQNSFSKEQFQMKACLASSTFTFYEKLRCMIACKKANLFFKRLNIPNIDNQKLVDIPWILAKTNGKIYEDGYPHTRDNIIFVSDITLKSTILDQILVHEKVHIYSRLYPTEMKNWMYQHKFDLVSSVPYRDIVRSNPDSDRLIYKDKNGRMMHTLFRSIHPLSLNDADYPVKNCPGSEHPNESLAYYIDYLYGLNK